MKVIPCGCIRCKHISCAVALDDQCLENPTWIEDNVLKHVCPSCKLKETSLELPNACLLHPIPIFYAEYCPACALKLIKTELGDIKFADLMSAIEVGEI